PATAERSPPPLHDALPIFATAPALAENLGDDHAPSSPSATEDDPSADASQNDEGADDQDEVCSSGLVPHLLRGTFENCRDDEGEDRKSTRLNSSHVSTSYA